MANVVNLRLFRKTKNRQEKERVADANRVKHGVSSKTRKAADKINKIKRSEHDGKKLPGAN